jgi:hypothetical protein
MTDPFISDKKQTLVRRLYTAPDSASRRTKTDEVGRLDARAASQNCRLHAVQAVEMDVQREFPIRNFSPGWLSFLSETEKNRARCVGAADLPGKRAQPQHRSSSNHYANIRHQQKTPQTSRGSSDRTDALAAVLFPVLMHADLVALVVHAGLSRRNAGSENAQRGECEEDWLHGLLRSVECGARIVATGFAQREQCKARPDNRFAIAKATENAEKKGKQRR